MKLVLVLVLALVASFIYAALALWGADPVNVGHILLGVTIIVAQTHGLRSAR